MMRKFRLFGVLLLVLALFPVRSYAVDFWPNGSYWNGITSPGHYAAFVRADDIYGAAAYGLNKDPASLSSDVRLKLSDPNYGGKFYEYAQTFYNVEGWPNMPEWVPTYVLAISVGLGQSFERVYASEVTTTLRDEALRDFERVLAGEDLSGGSGGGSGDVENVFPLALTDNGRNVQVYSSNFDGLRIRIGGQYYYVNDCYYGNESHSRNAPPVNLAFNSSLWSRYQSLVSSNPNLKFYIVGNASSDTLRVQGLLTDAPISIVDSGSYRTISFPYNTSSYHYYLLHNSSGKAFSSYMNCSYDSASGAFVLGLSYFSNCTGVNTRKVPSGSANEYYFLGQSSVGPPPPAGDWPEPEPTPTPTAPEVPTPTAPTVTPDPTPTEPTPTWPEIPTPTAPTVVTVETPEGLDYTQLLTLINDNLNDINSYTVAINSSLNSLRSDLVTEFEGLEQGLRNIYQYLQHLDDLLERHCKHIRDSIDENIYELELYLKDLFEWLPQQLDFDANFDYDDSGIKSYLQRILNKIPGGATGTPQTYMPNPQSDEPGFFDWLTDLWHRFLIDLVSVLPDELGGLVDAFSQLTHYFPFSIPWDLAALLALFEHEPVTPVFDVPWGFGGEEGEIEMVRVDLSAWDGVMEMVRPVFVVGFCWQLAMITKDLLGNFDINKGGV